jgi:transcription elongation GreA/GreB family factor
MTADLIARLTATISIEEPAARELVAALDQAVQLLQEDASEADQQATTAKQLGEAVEADAYREAAEQRWYYADDLGEWIGRLNTALLLPPDQRQALNG